MTPIVNRKASIPLALTVLVTLISAQSTADQDEKYLIDRFPETYMTVPEIIWHNHYPIEEHKVTTDDGYVLTLHRIPSGRIWSTSKKDVVFLQHGLLCSSAAFVLNGPSKSLAFVLADQGYDVWLGNSRGNTYSKGHVPPMTSDWKEYWQFSFDEMAHFDLPACIDYILGQTNQSGIHYIGHSQGTMIGFIEFGRRPDLGKKIKSFVALAPVTTVGHIKGLAKIMYYSAPYLTFMYKYLGGTEFLPTSWLMRFIADSVCAIKGIQKLCGNMIYLLNGFSMSNFNMTRLPIYLAHTPAGASIKDIVHFAQLMRSGEFRAFDWGKHGNIRRYGQATPPDYHPEKVQVPTALFTGEQDWLADKKDVEHVKSILPNIIYTQNIESFNHLDFMWGMGADEKLFPPILKILQQYSDTQ